MQFVDVAKEQKEKYSITKKGKYVFFIHNYSGDVTIDIDGSEIECYIYGLYIGRDQNNFKLNTIQRHNAPRSTSDLLIKGVFFDESRFIYEGLIRIEKKAQKSHAYQKNQNLIMSDKCFVDSRPFLEILANDVFCTHGSTTGGLNEEQIYYLKTRGIEEIRARELLIKGFANEILDKIVQQGIDAKISNIKDQISKIQIKD